MQWPPTSWLWKRVSGSKFLGAHRVGGEGENHVGSHWIRVAATVDTQLPHHGRRSGLVLSHTPNQAKVFVPGLGTFPVHPDHLSPSNEPLQWNRRQAQATLPAVGSLVNVRRAGEETQWMGRICEPLHNKSGGEPVLLERGAPGRTPEKVTVRADEVLGPHIPTKIKTRDGEWVKDALRRRSAPSSPLDEVVARQALQDTAPALEWPLYLSQEQQEVLRGDESAWFGANADQVRRVAREQAQRLRLSRADADAVEAEALRGALAALRLWAKAPDAAKTLTLSKLARDSPTMDASALSDDELRTQRALWRAFAHARASALSFLPKVASVSPIRESHVMDNFNSPSPSPSSSDLAAPVQSAVAALAPVVDAANLSGAARFLLLNALHLGHQGVVSLREDAPWPTVEGEEIASKLRQLFGVENATVDNLPGMWRFVRNRLSDAVRDDPTLFPIGKDGLLVKSVFAALIAETLGAVWKQRTQCLLKSFGAFGNEFQEWEHPRGHGRFIHKLQFAQHPAPHLLSPFGAGGGGSSSASPPPPSPSPPFVGGNTQNSSHDYDQNRPSWGDVRAGYGIALPRSTVFTDWRDGEAFYRALIGTNILAMGNVPVHFTQASFNHIFQNHPQGDRENRARYARFVPLTLQNPVEVWRDADGTLRYVACYEVVPATPHQQLKEISILDVVKIYQGRLVPDLTTMFPMTDDKQVEKKVRHGELLYTSWRGGVIDPDAATAP